MSRSQKTKWMINKMMNNLYKNYYLFPIPVSEILATNGVITQNDGYNIL